MRKTITRIIGFSSLLLTATAMPTQAADKPEFGKYCPMGADLRAALGKGSFHGDKMTGGLFRKDSLTILSWDERGDEIFDNDDFNLIFATRLVSLYGGGGFIDKTVFSEAGPMEVKQVQIFKDKSVKKNFKKLEKLIINGEESSSKGRKIRDKLPEGPHPSFIEYAEQNLSCIHSPLEYMMSKTMTEADFENYEAQKLATIANAGKAFIASNAEAQRCEIYAEQFRKDSQVYAYPGLTGPTSSSKWVDDWSQRQKEGVLCAPVPDSLKASLAYDQHIAGGAKVEDFSAIMPYYWLLSHSAINYHNVDFSNRPYGNRSWESDVKLILDPENPTEIDCGSAIRSVKAAQDRWGRNSVSASAADWANGASQYCTYIPDDVAVLAEDYIRRFGYALPPGVDLKGNACFDFAFGLSKGEKTRAQRQWLSRHYQDRHFEFSTPVQGSTAVKTKACESAPVSELDAAVAGRAAFKREQSEAGQRAWRAREAASVAARKRKEVNDAYDAELQAYRDRCVRNKYICRPAIGMVNYEVCKYKDVDVCEASKR